MIEAGITLVRLLLGLGAIFCLGYALLTLLVPRPRDFSGFERAAFEAPGRLPRRLFSRSVFVSGAVQGLPLRGGLNARGSGAEALPAA